METSVNSELVTQYPYGDCDFCPSKATDWVLCLVHVEPWERKDDYKHFAGGPKFKVCKRHIDVVSSQSLPPITPLDLMRQLATYRDGDANWLANQGEAGSALAQFKALAVAMLGGDLIRPPQSGTAIEDQQAAAMDETAMSAPNTSVVPAELREKILTVMREVFRGMEKDTSR